ncbi:hypothetical protein [uncultured Tenacibaculum sp.]|uniref:hypothetical protein n=1 Tax=uncultured Tenacibaculum sp. TaxID=174713 RepID=UPI00260F6836|nr:hypothetical protein [uncultured Tenacibaculum sp.]
MKDKRYLLDVAISETNGEVEELTPMLDGENVKIDGSGYLFPRHFEDEKSVDFICDFNGWIGENPFKYGYPISENMKLVLDKYNTLGKFLKTKVLFNENFLNYYVFELSLDSFSSFVDFENSTFCEWDELEKIGKVSMKIKNFSEVLKFRRENDWWGWGFDKGVMKSGFKEVDCIDMPYPYGILISERLKNALEEAELTGFKITPFPVEFEYLE